MATNKQFPRLRALILKAAASASMALAVAVTAFMPTGTVRASDWMPLLPDQDFYDFQLFAPPDLGSYNIWRRDDDGIYFNYDRLYWGITVPRTVKAAQTPDGLSIIPTSPISPFTIADLNNDYLDFSQNNPIVVQSTENNNQPEVNTLDNIASNTTLFEVGSDPLRLDLNTSWMRTKMTWGNRYEGGWNFDGRGVRLSYFQIGKQEQGFGSSSEFAVNSPTQVFTFETSIGGGSANNNDNQGGGGSVQTSITLETTVDSPQPDHVITQNLYQKNSTEIQSAGVAMAVQKHFGKRKGSTQATFSLGPRFIQLADRYEVDYLSYQNTFNTTVGGGGAGANTGNNANNSGVGATNPNAGTNSTAQSTVSGATGGTTGGNVTNNTGSNNGTTGNVSEDVFASSSGAGVLGISVGGLPSTITGVGTGSVFQAAQWETYTSNNLVGPEFGVMFEGGQGRWDWYAGGSFTAGFNWQNSIYKGANLPTNTGADYLRTNFAGGGTTTMNFASAGGGLSSNSSTVISVPTSPLITQVFPTGQSGTTNSAEHSFVFSPVGEWRLGGRFKISKGISFNFGYTGMWLSQLARASSGTAFRQVAKLAPRVSSNQTAIIEQNVAVVQGQTAIVSDANVLVGYVDAAVEKLPPLANGRYVPATITVGTEQGQRTVRNPEEFVQFENTTYTQQVPGNSSNEYVFTNGIDFGLEIKY